MYVQHHLSSRHYLSGAAIQIMMYSQNPMDPARSITRKRILMTVGSVSKYWATPPQTPAILRSVKLLVNFLYAIISKKN